jgi:PAS domain S-box-containing protein
MKDVSEFLSAEQYRAILRTSLDGFWLVDTEGRLLEVNDAYCQMTGFSREELLGMRIPDLCMVETPEQIREHTAQILREGSGRFESRHRKKDGGSVFLDVSVSSVAGPPVRVVAFLRDISARKASEDALRASEEKFSRIFQSSSNLVAFSEPEHGRIVDVNDTWVDALGISREEAVGKSGQELGLWRDPVKGERCRAMLRANGQLRDFEMEVHGKRGVLFVMASANYVDVRGSRYLLWELHDITRQKQAEREQEALRMQLLQAQKLESVGRLAGGVAHDFNNLLTVINGYSDLVLSKLAADDPVRHDVEEIRQAGDRASGLTQQLLVMSRTQVGQPRLMDLNNAVTETVRLVERLIGEDIHVVLRLDPKLGLVNADPIQIHQVLMNLAVNARDAMPEGGQLTLETCNATIGPEPVFAEVSGAGEFVRLTVRDTGIGMSAETITRIFEPFFTTKSLGTGTGLGLSTAHGIVRQAGGWINVRSAPGEGATFEVYLPRTAEAQAGAHAQQAAVSERGGSETILVVEDQPAVRQFAASVLRDLGYRVLEVGSGAEALGVSAAHEGPIHLVLTDVIMPGMNGLMLAERIAGQRPHARILFMTAYAGEVLQERGVVLESQHWLQKPFRPDELARKVREVLDRPPKGLTVLVLDDEVPVRRMLHDMLAEAGYSVIEAENGAAALAVLERIAVEVMLTDPMVPGKDVVDTIAEVRKRHPKIKIISMSGTLGGHSLKVGAFPAADARVAKPIERQELLSTIHEVLAGE